MRFSAHRMARPLAILFAALGLLTTAPALAGPLEDAEAAFDRGDYDEAARLWRPLAEQENAARLIKETVLHSIASAGSTRSAKACPKT